MSRPDWIIHRPQLQPLVQRTLWRMVTALMWALYLYLLAPLLTLVMWLLGFRITSQQLLERDYGVDPFVLLSLPLMALACAVLLIGWAEYNRRRFRRRPDRRKPLACVPHDQIATTLGASAEVVRQLNSSRITVLHMDEHAHPRAATARPVPALASPATRPAPGEAKASVHVVRPSTSATTLHLADE
ncbi:MAG: poly-beta-1,6-N-acetyl-D-glucosamine biosynthesis protein PgaD [Pseudoxanthomonas suwonensis]|nr:poly-beta-1,6-N-acetyl-D-glucosamine biosynthesis protein PgaD [Pseudoxanthomonas suwonensis]